MWKLNEIITYTVIVLVLLFGQTALTQSTANHTTTKTDHEMDNNRTSIAAKYANWMNFANRFVPWALWADRYVTLVYYIIGFPGNLISLIVWTSRRVYKGNSAAIYLAALSLNDIIILIFALHRDLGRNWDVLSSMTPGSCEILNTVFSAVQYASPLYVLGFTVERWLAVCRPFLIERICNAKRAIFVCGVIASATLLISVGNAIRFGTEPTHCYKRVDGFAINLYLALLEAIFSGIVPLMVLLFNCLVIRELARVHRTNKILVPTTNRVSDAVNIEVSVKRNRSRCSRLVDWFRCHCCLRFKDPAKSSAPSTAHVPLMRNNSQVKDVQSNCRRNQSVTQHGADGNNGPRQSHVGNPCAPEERHSPSFRSTTFMLLCVSFYMIIATLLAGLMYLLNHIFDEPDLTLTEEEALQDPVWLMTMRNLTIKTFGDEIAMSYYAFGFIIYYVTGHSFRERVHQLFRQMLIRCGCCRESLIKYRTSDDFDFTSASRRTQRRTTALRNLSLHASTSNEYAQVNADTGGTFHPIPTSNGSSNLAQSTVDLTNHTTVDQVTLASTNGINASDMQVPELAPNFTESHDQNDMLHVHSSELPAPIQQDFSHDCTA